MQPTEEDKRQMMIATIEHGFNLQNPYAILFQHTLAIRRYRSEQDFKKGVQDGMAAGMGNMIPLKYCEQSRIYTLTEYHP
jgi:hypothetical protein